MIPSHPSEFQYRTVPVQDMPGEDLVAHFPRVFEFINEAVSKQGGVLVQ